MSEETVQLGHRSRNRLHPGQLHHFPEETLHDRVARALCQARCLPRREFYESWAFVNRARRFLDAPVVWDLCAGHGLVGLLFALLEPDLERVVVLDKRRPPSHDKVRASLASIDSSRIAKVTYVESRIEKWTPPGERAFLVGVHACGRRTDRIIELAIRTRASVAVLPCCHDVKGLDVPPALLGRVDHATAVDATRIFTLHHAGYRTFTRTIAADATERSQALIALAPREEEAS